MRLEAVTVCMNYGDFFSHTAPLNRQHFDKWVVVTEPKDYHTQDICKYYGIDFVKTNAARLEYDEFRKGRCVTIGLSELSKTGWVLLIDADTILPPNFRKTLNMLEFNEVLDPSCLYMTDRIVFETFEEWMEFFNRPHVSKLNGRPRDGAFCLPDFVGAGFFQMWNVRETGIIQYIHRWVECGGEDIRFSYLWPRNKRILLPEINCYHIKSGPECNWRGRRSKPFKIDRSEETWQPHSLSLSVG